MRRTCFSSVVAGGSATRARRSVEASRVLCVACRARKIKRSSWHGFVDTWRTMCQKRSIIWATCIATAYLASRDQTKKAARIYKRAVELGDVEAMVNLGVLYNKPTFIKRDRKKAKQLYRAAAERGDVLGMLNLAEMIQFEPGGDLDEAKRWFERAVAGGLKDAKNGLEHLLMAPAPPTDVELRFKIGDSVECCTGTSWSSGNIVALWYRHATLPAGIYMPYQIELEDGELIYAPRDSDDCIRARLRFAIGTEVEVFSQDSDHDEPGPDELVPGSWAAGKVIDTWVNFEPAEHERARARENHLDEEELCAKYEVEYEEGNCGFVLYDDDLSIRLPPSSQETSEADVLRMYHSLGLSHS